MRGARDRGSHGTCLFCSHTFFSEATGRDVDQGVSLLPCCFEIWSNEHIRSAQANSRAHSLCVSLAESLAVECSASWPLGVVLLLDIVQTGVKSWLDSQSAPLWLSAVAFFLSLDMDRTQRRRSSHLPLRSARTVRRRLGPRGWAAVAGFGYRVYRTLGPRVYWLGKASPDHSPFCSAQSA